MLTRQQKTRSIRNSPPSRKEDEDSAEKREFREFGASRPALGATAGAGPRVGNGPGAVRPRDRGKGSGNTAHGRGQRLFSSPPSFPLHDSDHLKQETVMLWGDHRHTEDKCRRLTKDRKGRHVLPGEGACTHVSLAQTRKQLINNSAAFSSMSPTLLLPFFTSCWSAWQTANSHQSCSHFL